MSGIMVVSAYSPGLSHKFFKYDGVAVMQLSQTLRVFQEFNQNRHSCLVVWISLLSLKIQVLPSRERDRGGASRVCSIL